MSSMNHTILLGGLTRDPALRHAGAGGAFCKFSLAVTEEYKDKSGKEQKSKLYHEKPDGLVFSAWLNRLLHWRL